MTARNNLFVFVRCSPSTQDLKLVEAGRTQFENRKSLNFILPSSKSDVKKIKKAKY